MRADARLLCGCTPLLPSPPLSFAPGTGLPLAGYPAVAAELQGWAMALLTMDAGWVFLVVDLLALQALRISRRRRRQAGPPSMAII